VRHLVELGCALRLLCPALHIDAQCSRCKHTISGLRNGATAWGSPDPGLGCILCLPAGVQCSLIRFMQAPGGTPAAVCRLRGNGEVIKAEDFEKRKAAADSARAARLNKRPSKLASQGRDLSEHPLLQVRSNPVKHATASSNRRTVMCVCACP
jgi:hypothetical protein